MNRLQARFYIARNTSKSAQKVARPLHFATLIKNRFLHKTKAADCNTAAAHRCMCWYMKKEQFYRFGRWWNTWWQRCEKLQLLHIWAPNKNFAGRWLMLWCRSIKKRKLFSFIQNSSRACKKDRSKGCGKGYTTSSTSHPSELSLLFKPTPAQSKNYSRLKACS